MNIGFIVEKTEANGTLFFLLSWINCLLGVLICILASVAINKKTPEHKLLPGMISAVLCAITAYVRLISVGSADNEALYVCCTLLLFLLNYICVFLFFPGKKCLKPFLVTTGLGFADALKYIVLMFLSYDYKSSALDLLVEIITGIFIFVVTLVLYFVRLKRFQTEKPRMKPDIPLYLLVLTSIGVFIVTIAVFGINYSEKTRFAFLLALLNIPLVGATVLYAASKTVKSKLSEENYRRRLDMQLQHFGQMEKKNEELRVFRHDFSKKLRPAVVYLSEAKTQEALDILSQFTKEIEASRQRYNTGNFMLDTVLECEQQIAEKNGVNISLAVGSVFPESGISPDDIYTIFPNALDNAVEASVLSAEKKEVLFSSRVSGETVYVSIKNPCGDNIGRNAKLETSKNDKNLHGYGLKSIKKAASKYGEENVEYFTKDGYFNLRITLKYMNNEGGQA